MSARRTTAATTADVARLAGVSAATVSRTLANPEIVSETTRERVLAAVRETGFTPNAAARNLRVRKAMMALVVVPDIANPFFAEVLRGIDAALSAEGYGLIIGNIDNDTGKETAFIRLALSRQVDGVLLLCGHLLKADGLALDDARIPVVAACETIPDAAIPQVAVDNREAAAAAVGHLVALGHRRIAYLAGPAANILDRQRRQGFLDALAAAAIAPDDRLMFSGDFTFQSGVAAARAVLAMPEDLRPTALFAANDEMAIGCLRTIMAAGLAVPGDFSIVGFDAIEYADYFMPALSTVRQPRREIGETAGGLLVRLMAGEALPPETIILRAELMMRGSVGQAPGSR